MNFLRRLVQFFFFSPNKVLTTTQIHVWSVVIGAVLGTFVTGYSYLIELLLKVLWKLLPWALEQAGIFGPQFPSMNLNWMVPLVNGGLVAGLMLAVLKRFHLSTGSIITAIQGVHKHGLLPIRQVLPMFFVSLITITAGGSAGPEASVIIMGGGLMEGLNWLLKQPKRERRILTMCGMSASLAAFFGMPLTGALFVLEVPHHNGLEFYEAISPCVVSSVVAAILNKIITQKPLGGAVSYISIPKQLDFVDLGRSLLLGVLAGITALVFIGMMKGMKWLVERVGLSRHPLPLSLLGSMMVGICGVTSPSSLFWSENELQWAVAVGNTTLPYAQAPGLIPFNSPLLGWELAVAGIIKLIAITFTVCGGWPGGIIFPLFFSGALLGSAWGTILNIHPTVASTTFMAALMASVLRTPWASVLIVLLTVAGGSESKHFIEVFPLTMCSVMVSMIIVYWSRLYGKNQHGRRDLMSNEDDLDTSIQEDDVVDGDATVSALFQLDFGDRLERHDDNDHYRMVVDDDDGHPGPRAVKSIPSSSSSTDNSPELLDPSANKLSKVHRRVN